MLDDRKAAILRAVVQEYIATAQPVGSTHVARAPGVGVSSATVRNEMAVLEQEGYLAQPHTSAGRVPTDQGYRFFVDHLGRPGQADALTTRQVGEFFSASHGRLEEMLHHTSDLLTQLTRNAAVVVGPKVAEVPMWWLGDYHLTPTVAEFEKFFDIPPLADIDPDMQDKLREDLLTHGFTRKPIIVNVFAETSAMAVDPRPFVVTLMVAASASFATPFGYQTNLMVFNVGGYRFHDFVRVGLPLTFLVGLVTVGVVPLAWPF